MKYIYSILLLIPFITFGQDGASRKIDTSFYIAILKNDVGYGGFDSSCYINYNHNSNKHRVVVITGYHECVSRNFIKRVYSFSYDGVEYFADTVNFVFNDKHVFFAKYPFWAQLERDKYREHALLLAEDFPKIQKNIAIDKLNSYKKYGVGIVSQNAFDESEYTEGTGYAIKIYNPTDKTIKYMWITLIGYNPVNDKIIDPISRTSSIQLTCVGPINPHATGSYEFNYVWHTDLVDHTKIISVKVQYTDGQVKNIQNISPLFLDSETIDQFFN